MGVNTVATKPIVAPSEVTTMPTGIPTTVADVAIPAVVCITTRDEITIVV